MKTPEGGPNLKYQSGPDRIVKSNMACASIGLSRTFGRGAAKNIFAALKFAGTFASIRQKRKPKSADMVVVDESATGASPQERRGAFGAELHCVRIRNFRNRSLSSAII